MEVTNGQSNIQDADEHRRRVIIPLSHLAQGLFQASPSVAQHSDFKVAPLMLTSQRLLTIFSQQVLLVVSVPW